MSVEITPQIVCGHEDCQKRREWDIVRRDGELKGFKVKPLTGKNWFEIDNTYFICSYCVHFMGLELYTKKEVV